MDFFFFKHHFKHHMNKNEKKNEKETVESADVALTKAWIVSIIFFSFFFRGDFHFREKRRKKEKNLNRYS